MEWLEGWLDTDIRMRELYFVSPYGRSIRTIHFQYGSSGKKYILKIISGEINGRGTSDGNTVEVMFDGEQELLKGVYESEEGITWYKEMGNN